MFERITGDDFHDGDVGPREEADQPHQADDGVLGGHQRRQTVRVKS